MMGQYDAALACYEKVLSPADAHYNLAILSRARNDHARSEIEFERAAALADMSVKR
jgi:tetratricopeptide (TPR) repeat protein